MKTEVVHANENIVDSVLLNMRPPEFFPAKVEGDTPYALIPTTMMFSSLEGFGAAPIRIRQELKFTDLNGFIHYVNTFKSEQTALFSSPRSLVAVLDYHAPGKPAFCQHKADFPMVETVDWQGWKSGRDKLFQQAEFVNQIESLRHTVTQPSAAELLAAIKAIRATVTHKQVSVIDDDGESASLQFSRDVSIGSAKSTEVRLPKQLVIRVRPFVGLDSAYELEIRINYRVENDASGIKLSYTILNYDQALEAAYREILGKVAKETNVTPFAGGEPR